MQKPELVLQRNSERSTYRRCRLKWDWSYNLKLNPPRDKGALVLGRLAHKALEIRYPPGRKRGPHPAKTFEKLYRRGDYDFSQWDEEGNKVDALELGLAMMNGYVAEYGADDHIEIIQPECTIQIDVCDRQGNYICTWVGTADAAYMDLARSSPRRKVVGALEHKTAKSIEEELTIVSGYGEQALSYTWALDMWLHHNDHLPADQHLDHVKFNWLKKALPDERPVNEHGQSLNMPKKDALLNKLMEIGVSCYSSMKVEELSALLVKHKVNPLLLGEPSKRQPGKLFHRWNMDVSQGNLKEINRRIRAEAWEMAQVRAGKLPIIKNPTKDCKWDCPFQEACELHEMGAEFEDMLEMEFTTWNPYEDHELELEKV